MAFRTKKSENTTVYQSADEITNNVYNVNGEENADKESEALYPDYIVENVGANSNARQTEVGETPDGFVGAEVIEEDNQSDADAENDGGANAETPAAEENAAEETGNANNGETDTTGESADENDEIEGTKIPGTNGGFNGKPSDKNEKEVENQKSSSDGQTPEGDQNDQDHKNDEAAKKNGILKKTIIGLGVALGVTIAVVVVLAVLGSKGLLTSKANSKTTSTNISEEDNSNWKMSASQKSSLLRVLPASDYISKTTRINAIKGLIPVIDANNSQESIQLYLDVEDGAGKRLLAVTLDKEVFGSVKSVGALISLMGKNQDKIFDIDAFEKADPAKAETKGFKSVFEQVCVGESEGYLDDIYLQVYGGKGKGGIDALGFKKDANGDYVAVYGKYDVFTLNNAGSRVSGKEVQTAFAKEYGNVNGEFVGSIENNLDGLDLIVNENFNATDEDEENKDNEASDIVDDANEALGKTASEYSITL